MKSAGGQGVERRTDSVRIVLARVRVGWYCVVQLIPWVTVQLGHN